MASQVLRLHSVGYMNGEVLTACIDIDGTLVRFVRDAARPASFERDVPDDADARLVIDEEPGA